jgi:hypothetical protein
MNTNPTLRSLKGTLIVVECRACRLYSELDRKEVVRRFKASALLSRVRRGVVGHCDRMCADGADRCEAILRCQERPRSSPPWTAQPDQERVGNFTESGKVLRS